MGKKKNAYRILVGKPEGKRPLGRRRRRWVNNVFLLGGTKSLGTATTSGLLYKPQMIGEGDCGAIGGMKMAGETEVLGENLMLNWIVER
jgi:hypothetical protein